MFFQQSPVAQRFNAANILPRYAAPMNPTRNQLRHDLGIFSRKVFWVFGVCFALALTGCTLLNVPRSQPKARVNSLQLTNGPTGPVTVEVLQLQVMRFADSYVATIAQAADDVALKATNPAIRLTAVRWKLGQATAAFISAAGPNPAVNALDILVQTTMARMVVEDYGVQTYGDTILPLLDAQRNMETNAWQMACSVLRPSQQQELRDLIAEWRQKNPHQRYVGPVRFREFVSVLGRVPSQSSTSPTSIFSLLYLDPLAGLDPTAAAIQETRELGERAMFYSQRMPMLLSWQAEVLAYQLADQHESRQILSDASRLASSAELFAQTAQQIPQLVNDQRQAAIQQIFSEANKSRELLTDTRSTLDSAGMAATNINSAIQSLTAFVQYVSPTNSSPADTNRPPFNVLDYGTAATQISAAATNLNALLASVNGSLPQMQELSQQTRADAEAVMRRAFVYGLALVMILLAGAVLAGLTYRFLANKLPKSNDPK